MTRIEGRRNDGTSIGLLREANADFGDLPFERSLAEALCADLS